MASIFRKDDNFVETPNRNTYDMSFQNNLTLDIGSLRPCFCQPVMPGDSWSIESVHGLRFMPLTYPIQTRMKSSIHFFYVRNRNLWKDWPDFIGKTKEGLVPPYIHLTESNRKQIETCQLGDFLGMPTKVYGYSTIGTNLDDMTIRYADFVNKSFSATQYGTMYVTEFTNIATGQNYADIIAKRPNDSGQYPGVYGVLCYQSFVTGSQLLKQGQEYAEVKIDMDFETNVYGIDNRMCLALFDMSGNLVRLSQKYTFDGNNTNFTLALPLNNRNAENIGDISGDAEYLLMFCSPVNWTNSSEVPDMSVSAIIVEDSRAGVDVAELPLSQLPYRSDANPSGIPISALPFRGYESIYNAFYRNPENNPLMINGVPEYNKWIRTNEGGADTNFYPIMYHNWEDDFLTTAVPSPQQGNAPLVGLSGTPTLTVAHDDGTTTQMQLDVNDEGQVTAVSAVSGDAATTSALMEAVSYGIAINDLRNVNSFQRWLENNIRRGYKYRDQIKTHYGVSVRYDELDMPEFIGGISEPVMVNQISQTVATDDGALGDMAGQASVFGQSKNITHYCDEHGFIIGIICVKPVANYSQLLPKFFNVTDTFDYYFPEFGHIGMQPITYAEVTPLQANLEGKLNDVFGYQRAWYDLISKTDEVHGLFRDDLRNFLINRTFDGTPELGKEFTVMSPDQINDVFAYTENTDKILGQVFFKCSKKTPIPLYGIPKLE